MALGEALPNVVPPEEVGQLEEEVRAYQIDLDLVPHAQVYVEEDSRVDVDWWSRVASLKNPERGVRYPTLIKLVKALLSIFTGPLVEGSFNLMDDILEADRSSLNVETYESLTVVKGIVHFEIKIWYLSAYPKGIQDVGVFFSSVDPILIFLGQTVLVCQSYNGRYRSLSL